MKQNILQQITTPKNYVGTKFTNLATSEQFTCTVTEQTNIDVLVKYFGGMKSYTIDFFEMNIQDGIFVVVPNAPDVKNYVGTMFKEKDFDNYYTVKHQNDDYIICDYTTSIKTYPNNQIFIKLFKEMIAKGAWVIVLDVPKTKKYIMYNGAWVIVPDVPEVNNKDISLNVSDRQVAHLREQISRIQRQVHLIREGNTISGDIDRMDIIVDTAKDIDRILCDLKTTK